MFGKGKDIETLGGDITIDQFFGDEAAAAEVVRVDELLDRVDQVEQQVNSQFTSLAAYAQIAQEQIELARSEAKHATERAEQRVTELIERERADRIAGVGTALSNDGSGAAASGWTAPDVEARLVALERSVAQIQHGLNECLARQKALADAITALFEPQVAARQAEEEEAAAALDGATLPPPPVSDSHAPTSSGPIGGLAML